MWATSVAKLARRGRMKGGFAAGAHAAMGAIGGTQLTLTGHGGAPVGGDDEHRDRGRVVHLKERFGFIRPLNSGVSTSTTSKDLFFSLHDTNAEANLGDVFSYDVVSDPAKGGAAGKRAVRLRRVGGDGGAIDEISSALQAMTGEDGQRGGGHGIGGDVGGKGGKGGKGGGAPHGGPPLSDVLFRLRQLVALGDSDSLVLSGGELLEIMGREDLPQVHLLTRD